MSDSETTEDATYAEGEESRILSIEDLTAKVDRLTEMVSKILPGSRKEAGERTERRLDRPSNVEERVRAELKRAADEEAARKAKDDERAERETVAQRLARLEESPPAPPVPRRTKMLGWGS